MWYPQKGSMAIGSRRTWPTVPAAAAVISEPMVEATKTPWPQLNAWKTSGTVVDRRPPKMRPLIGTPAGFSHSGSRLGHCDRGAVNRAFGMRRLAAAIRRPGLAAPVGQPGRRLVGHPFPPDVAVLGHGHVREDRVLLDRLHRVGVGAIGCAGGDAEEAVLGVDGEELPVLTLLDPGDVVAHRGDLPPLEPLGRDQHREIGLAAGAGERRGDVRLLALGRFRAQDQHVLREPALVVGHARSDPQGEAFLAQQRIAAVTAAVRPDRPLLGELDDVLLLRVAGPRHVLAARGPGASPPSARRGRRTRRPGRRGPRCPCGS